MRAPALHAAASKWLLPDLPSRRDRSWATRDTRQLSQQKQAAYAEWQRLLSLAQDPTAEPAAAAQAEAEAAEAKTKYRQLDKAAQRQAQADYDSWLLDKAAEMDRLMRARRLHQAHALVDQLRGKPTSPAIRAIRHPAGGLVFGSEVAAALATHFEALYNVPTQVATALLSAIPSCPGANRPNCHIAQAALALAPKAPAQPAPEPQPNRARTRFTTAREQARAAHAASQPPATATAEAAALAADASPPSMEEVCSAIAGLRNTSPGANAVSAPMLKLGAAAAAAVVHEIVCMVWDLEQAPAEWKQALLVALHKKDSPTEADNYRGITLLDVVGKVYVSIIHNRIRAHLCNQLMDAQHGFRPGSGTNGAVCSMRIMMELSRARRTPLHAAFVDFRKAFDSVNREALWAVLAARGVAPKLVTLIKDLYSGCSASVRTSSAQSAPFPMGTGVRQGCPMSPTLFVTFFDFLTRLVTLRCTQKGVQGVRFTYKVGDQLLAKPSGLDSELCILMLLYADDLVIMADSAADLQAALMELEAAAAEWGMQLNYDKTKAVVFAAAPGGPPATPIQLAHGVVKMDTEFTYLGSVQCSSVQQDVEINRRLYLAGRAFNDLWPRVFKAGTVSLTTKMRIYKAIVVPTLLYGAAESWALTRAQEHKLDVFNNNNLRRITGQRRGPDGISNAQLYELTGQPAVSALIREHRLRWFGHLVRRQGRTTEGQLMFATRRSSGAQVQGTRARSHASWRRVVQEDLTAPEMHNWPVLAFNKKDWESRVSCRSIVA